MYYGTAQRGQNIYEFAFEFAELDFWKISQFSWDSQQGRDRAT